jgi:hypothetical protein
MRCSKDAVGASGAYILANACFLDACRLSGWLDDDAEEDADGDDPDGRGIRGLLSLFTEDLTGGWYCMLTEKAPVVPSRNAMEHTAISILLLMMKMMGDGQPS